MHVTRGQLVSWWAIMRTWALLIRQIGSDVSTVAAAMCEAGVIDMEAEAKIMDAVDELEDRLRAAAESAYRMREEARTDGTDERGG